MKTLPPLVIEQASNGSSDYIAFRIVHQDDKLIRRGFFRTVIGAFNFESAGCPQYRAAKYDVRDTVYLQGDIKAMDGHVLIIPFGKVEAFKRAVFELNQKLSPDPRVVVFRYKTGSNPNSVHEVEVTEETSTHIKGIKRGDEGGFRSYLKKNIVGGKIVEL